jgi:hypothetical protein
VRHYSPRTEITYRHWVRRFILFHGKRHPDELAAPEITAFLNHLAVREHVRRRRRTRRRARSYSCIAGPRAGAALLEDLIRAASRGGFPWC